MLVVFLLMFFDSFIGMGIFSAPKVPLAEHFGAKSYFFRPSIYLTVMYYSFCIWAVFWKKKRPN